MDGGGALIPAVFFKSTWYSCTLLSDDTRWPMIHRLVIHSGGVLSKRYYNYLSSNIIISMKCNAYHTTIACLNRIQNSQGCWNRYWCSICQSGGKIDAKSWIVGSSISFAKLAYTIVNHETGNKSDKRWYKRCEYWWWTNCRWCILFSLFQSNLDPIKTYNRYLLTPIQFTLHKHIRKELDNW